MANALDANIGPVRGPQAEPDERGPMFRIRQGLLTFRFVELLTRTPTPRPLRSSSWGYGFLADPSPRSSSDCTMPTTPRITNPRAANSRGVHALTDPASVPCPRPLASPILELSIPVGSKHSQFRRLRQTHNLWRPQSSSCRFPRGPSPRRSGDCTMPPTPGITDPRVVDSRGVQARAAPATAPSPRPLASPILKPPIPTGFKPSQFQRVHHAQSPWRFPTL